MDVLYPLQGNIFVWDAGKANSNRQKHGVTFEEAAEAFLDPFYQTGDASTPEEERDFLLGYTLSQRLLLVVHVQRHDYIRLISARPATPAERKIYEQG